MKKEKSNYGTVTIGAGTYAQEELGVNSYVQAHFIDNRSVAVMELEDKTYCISIENLPSTGRQVSNTIRLGLDSMAALVSAVMIYCKAAGIDLSKVQAGLAIGEQIDFRISRNLKIPFQKRKK